MDLTTTIFIILLSITLIVIGFLMSDKIKNFLFLPIAGGVLLMIVGLMMFSNPLTYKIGEQNEEIYTYGGNFTNSVHWDEAHPSDYPSFNPADDPIYLFHINETIGYEFGEVENNTNNLLSWVLLLVGFITFLIASLKIYDRRFEEDNYTSFDL